MQGGVDASRHKALSNSNDVLNKNTQLFPCPSTPSFNNSLSNNDNLSNEIIQWIHSLNPTTLYSNFIEVPNDSHFAPTRSKFCYAGGSCSCTPANDCLCAGTKPSYCIIRDTPISFPTYAPAHAPIVPLAHVPTIHP